MDELTSHAAKRVKLDAHNTSDLPGNGVAIPAEDAATKLVAADGDKDTANGVEEIKINQTMDNGESAEKPPKITEEVARELLEYFRGLFQILDPENHEDTNEDNWNYLDGCAMMQRSINQNPNEGSQAELHWAERERSRIDDVLTDALEYNDMVRKECSTILDRLVSNLMISLLEPMNREFESNSPEMWDIFKELTELKDSMQQVWRHHGWI